MSKIKKVYGKIKNFYMFLTEKRYSTLSGTLSFFLIMSVVPLCFVIMVFFSGLNLNLSVFENTKYFYKIELLFGSVIPTVKEATKTASVIFFFTAFYSGTGLFYHMKKSGEIIYAEKRIKKGVLVRLSAAALVILLLTGFVLVSLLYAVVIEFLDVFNLKIFTDIAVKTLFLLFLYAILVALNVFICPHKIKIKECLIGSAFTLVFWIVSSIIFGLYVDYFADYQRLYGALSLFIVTIIYIYLLAKGFVVGVILNYRLKTRKNVI